MLACYLMQAEGSSLFKLVKTTMATGFQLSSEHHFELIGVQQHAARMIEQLDTPPYICLQTRMRTWM